MTDHCPSCPFKGCETCRYQGDAHFQAVMATQRHERHLPPAPTGLTFTAYGIVAGQGSKRHVGGGVMIEQSKRVKPWRSKVYGVRPGARIHVEPIGGAS